MAFIPNLSNKEANCGLAQVVIYRIQYFSILSNGDKVTSEPVKCLLLVESPNKVCTEHNNSFM